MVTNPQDIVQMFDLAQSYEGQTLWGMTSATDNYPLLKRETKITKLKVNTCSRHQLCTSLYAGSSFPLAFSIQCTYCTSNTKQLNSKQANSKAILQKFKVGKRYIIKTAILLFVFHVCTV